MNRSSRLLARAALVAALPALVAVGLPGVAAAATPEVPTAVAVQRKTDTSATLSWNPPRDAGGVTGYLVARDGVDASGTVDWSKPLGAGSRSVTFKGLLPDIEYQLTVRAIGPGGEGPARSARVTTGSGLRFVSDLPWVSATGALRDRSSGGGGLTLAGRPFRKGVGAQAPSSVTVTVPAGCSKLLAVAGVDDAVGSAGSVEFSVLRGSTAVWRSGRLTGASANAAAAVAVTAGSRVTLRVTDAGDGTAADRADWGDARFVCKPTTGVVATGLSNPWSVVALPGGASALVSERGSGAVKRVTAAGGVTRLRGSFGSTAAGETGLLGLALSPTFGADRLLYAFVSTPIDNRIVRATVDGTTLRNPQAVFTGIPKGTQHSGGRIGFGPDGYLYIGTGDTNPEAGAPNPAQNPRSLAGKILRITRDGQAAPGNPGGSWDPAVFSIGHRNVQGLAFSGTARAPKVWATEFGDTRWDEVNLVQRGRNYGWPNAEGPSSNPAFTDPYAAWDPADASPSGATVSGGQLYVAALRGERLLRVPLAGGLAPSYVAQNTFGRLRDVQRVGNVLWVATDDGRIVRVAGV